MADLDNHPEFADYLARTRALGVQDGEALRVLRTLVMVYKEHPDALRRVMERGEQDPTVFAKLRAALGLDEDTEEETP